MTAVLVVLALILLVLGGFVVALNLRVVKPEVTDAIEPLYSTSDPQFERAMGSFFGPPFVPGNRITTLSNGDQIFPAMLAAIRRAERTITFETFIYWSGSVGRHFANALAERARAGVRVHVLLDWVGARQIDPDALRIMMGAGAEVERYHPLRWFNIMRMNKRTHRKLLVVDGRVGFTGGVGVGDEWSGHAQDDRHWRDVHYRVEGPVVAQMQAAFMENWVKSRGEVLHGQEYFPRLEEAGTAAAQLHASAALDESAGIRLMYLFAIASARGSIRIATAYFVPDAVAIERLIQARQRDVRVQILVPGRKTDYAITRRASRASWLPLLEAGVEIYEYQPTMYHCKIFIAGDVFVSVGSTNFDTRSFHLNDEANLNVLDRDFAREQIEIFERDRRSARQIVLDEWRSRPVREKMTEYGAALFRSQL
jgi:cardiolipin synthase A/B